MENGYQIANPSQELIVEAIRKTPMNPGDISLHFLADGLKIPYKGEEIGEYMRLCKRGNIIPFSRKNVRYGFEVKENIPNNEEGVRAFFGGGRTNEISMNVNDSYEQRMIERFSKILLPSLIENNYKIVEGHITFSDHKVGSHENEGYDPDLELRLNWGDKKGLSLLLDDYYVKDPQKKMFEDWFEDLKKKYSVKI
jgi:hypothetical protein